MLTELISHERTPAHRDDSTMPFGPRRGGFINAADRVAEEGEPLDKATVEQCEAFDLIYRTLCAVMFNYAPLSGHPGGSISSGRFVARLLFDTMDYDLSRPQRRDADIISYAAGHKALGLYAMWALRNEIARIAAPELLPIQEQFQFRLEDLLGFRRNPAANTPLFKQFRAKPLDGHSTPATPFVRLSTGASGVGIPASFGLAWAAADVYGENAPRIHIIEGEGGMTPGRVAEALAAAGTASLDNIILHIDWNQASIDSNRVCRDGETPGEYVQWTPAELAYLHDWNVIYVPDGFDWQQITVAQRLALDLHNGQPTAIVYRTIKGWRYGMEGRASHGSGHGLCSNAFFTAVAPLLPKNETPIPHCDGAQRCNCGTDTTILEECYWQTLGIIRHALEMRPSTTEGLAAQLRAAQKRLDTLERKPRPDVPRIDIAYETAAHVDGHPPAELALKFRTKATLRDELGRVLNHYIGSRMAAWSLPRRTCLDRQASTKSATVSRLAFTTAKQIPAHGNSQSAGFARTRSCRCCRGSLHLVPTSVLARRTVHSARRSGISRRGSTRLEIRHE
jgi:transketolase